MNIADRVTQLEEEIQSIGERLSDIRVIAGNHNILSATHLDTIVAAPVNNDILHYSGGDWQKTDSPSLDDLTIVTPVNIYALSHDSFADYAANEHFTEASIDHGNILGLADKDHKLNNIANPDGNVLFTMTTRQIRFNFTNPATADGGFEIEASGAFSGDLVHIHQHTGNPGAVDLMHLEADDADVVPLRINGSGAYDVICGAISASNMVLSGTLGCGAITTSADIVLTGATTRQIKRDVDNQPLYIAGGSAYSHGASLQFYGEDHGVFPGSAYIVSGSHDVSPASIIQFAYRNAGAYQAIMTLGADRHIDIWDWDDNAMREISFGADDSGDPGFKVLQVPN